MLKNLKSLFFVEEESKESKKGKPATTKQSVSPKTTVPSGKPLEGNVTDKFTKILLEALERNNLKGFDYLEFRQSVLSLEKVQLDEATRFQSAAAMAGSMGVSSKKMIDSAQHYINVLDQESNKFKQAVAGRFDNQIGTKKQELKDLEATVKQKTAQIQQLTKEIEQHQKKAKTLSQKITKDAEKIKKTEADFIASHQLLVGQIKGDVEKIKQYLK